MPPANTVDSTMNFADPVFLGILAVFAIALLLATGRWLWLAIRGVVHRRLSRKELVELIALSIPLAALAVTVGYTLFIFAEAAAWSR